MGAKQWAAGQAGDPFDYTASRAQEVSLRLLEGYRGYLMTDDYAGYNAVAARDGIERLGCWAHARRKFVEAQKVQPKGKTGRADVALTSATGWSYSFTLLRLAPALIWESGERPALFAGTVAIDTTPAETNGSAPGTPPAVVGQPTPEGLETPPWECPRSDTALPTAAPPVPDVMEDMLAMVGLDRTADMGKGEDPVEKVPAPTTAAASPLPLTPAPGPASTPTVAIPSGEHFMTWLQQGVAARRLIINDAKALVHTVSDTAYLVSPSVFQRYA